ncbi:MAG: (deoxy)nucleoside triphosphate pyrophosphohydrolase [Candidatus Delongbacteria bacterium]|nr:(deoxy)nucleoside triphosphate pyrophosphohydrolase [Candidatus Delongbacteria bacterium]
MQTIHVVAAVIVQNGTVFSAQRPDAGEAALKWEFPGGKIESGESHEAALIREIWEEFSVTITVGSRLMTVRHPYQSFLLVMHAYLATIVEGKIQPAEHLATRWLSHDEIQIVDWAPADLPIVAEIERLRLLA